MEERIQKKVTVLNEKWRLFLDMKIIWEKAKLFLRVYCKENQQLKYVDRQSTHRLSIFKSITTIVPMWLSRLMSRDDGLDEVYMDSIYLEHTNAIDVADLAPEEFLAFGKNWRKDNENLAKQKQYRKYGQTIYFVISYSKFIHDKKSCTDEGHLEMLQHFSGDFGGKVMKFISCPCNCNSCNKIEGECAFKGK
eukprot:15326440-Ditylum_brightwellii.AAC.1